MFKVTSHLITDNHLEISLHFYLRLVTCMSFAARAEKRAANHIGEKGISFARDMHTIFFRSSFKMQN